MHIPLTAGSAGSEAACVAKHRIDLRDWTGAAGQELCAGCLKLADGPSLNADGVLMEHLATGKQWTGQGRDEDARVAHLAICRS